MKLFDVFNGDADGILSLVQLRQACPRPEAKLITGRKRDISLLSQVEAGEDDHVTVLDISMRSNHDDLLRILDAGASVFYADHHNAGDIPDHHNLEACIDTESETCTAMIVDRCLRGSYRAWAVTAAFGDNFPALARRKAKGFDLPMEALERLGMLINYNGYGASLAELHMHPADLYRMLVQYKTPMAFLAHETSTYETLNSGYESDLESTNKAIIMDQSLRGQILKLPNKAASRRVSGVFGNQLAQANPDKAHAILTESEGGYVVSVRAPLVNRRGADLLCLQFDTGGGRPAAAGINHLPQQELNRFITVFRESF